MIDYKALAKRIERLADDHDLYATQSGTDEAASNCHRIAADLRTVVSLLEGMAGMEPAARIYTDAELVHRDPRWGRVCWIVPECEIDGGALLYLHPAPQPQSKCWCRACLTPAELLCTFVVCPKCGDKRCPRADDHRNACVAPQPQPERQPVSEPTEAQIEQERSEPEKGEMNSAIDFLRNLVGATAHCDAVDDTVVFIGRLRSLLDEIERLTAERDELRRIT